MGKSKNNQSTISLNHLSEVFSIYPVIIIADGAIKNKSSSPVFSEEITIDTNKEIKTTISKIWFGLSFFAPLEIILTFGISVHKIIAKRKEMNTIVSVDP